MERDYKKYVVTNIYEYLETIKEIKKDNDIVWKNLKTTKCCF